MTPEVVRHIRVTLKLTQATLARLLDQHPMTISKWERGVSRPSPHCASLLYGFAQTAVDNPRVGTQATELLARDGIASALRHLLDAVKIQQGTNGSHVLPGCHLAASALARGQQVDRVAVAWGKLCALGFTEPSFVPEYQGGPVAVNQAVFVVLVDKLWRYEKGEL